MILQYLHAVHFNKGAVINYREMGGGGLQNGRGEVEVSLTPTKKGGGAGKVFSHP